MTKRGIKDAKIHLDSRLTLGQLALECGAKLMKHDVQQAVNHLQTGRVAWPKKT